MRHSAHSHTKPPSEQDQAGNKLLAVISFLRGILFSCIPCLTTHTLLGPGLLLTAFCQHRHSRAAPGAAADGELQEGVRGRQVGLCQDPEPRCRTATVWANTWLKPLQEPSELHLQHLPWKSHSSVHRYSKNCLSAVYFYFKWHLSLWYLQVSQVLDFGSQIFASKPGTVHRDLS